MPVVGSITVLKKEKEGDLIKLTIKTTGGKVSVKDVLIVEHSGGYNRCEIQEIQVDGEYRIEVRHPEDSDITVYIAITGQSAKEGAKYRVEDQWVEKHKVNQFRVAKSPI